MRERFRGKEGKARLVEALGNQELVLHDHAVAQRLAAAATLKEYATGTALYVQGEPGRNHLHLEVAGSMDLLVKDKPVAVISAGQAVGEFPILDPALSYTVTIRTREPSVVARVSEEQLRAIAAEHPRIWEYMARMLMQRLHRSHDLVPAARPPCIFIGYGRGALWRRLQDHLQERLELETVAYESESRAGISIVSVLEQMLARASFAILVLTAEDETAYGARRARQNVVHEAGLFQGALGFRRAVLLVQRGLEEFSNVDGLQHIAFDGGAIETAFGELGQVLAREAQISPERGQGAKP